MPNHSARSTGSASAAPLANGVRARQGWECVARRLRASPGGRSSHEPPASPNQPLINCSDSQSAGPPGSRQTDRFLAARRVALRGKQTVLVDRRVIHCWPDSAKNCRRARARGHASWYGRTDPTLCPHSTNAAVGRLALQHNRVKRC